MDELMLLEETKQKQMDVELKRLRELHFKKMQELYESRTAERNTEAEIQVYETYRYLFAKVIKDWIKGMSVGYWYNNWSVQGRTIAAIKLHKFTYEGTVLIWCWINLNFKFDICP